MAPQSATVSQPAAPSARTVLSPFGKLWDEALQRYQDETGKDLLELPMAAGCPSHPDNAEEVMEYFKQRESFFKEFRAGGAGVRGVLKPIVDIVLFLKEGAEGAADAVPGGEVMFGAIGVLLQATKGVSGLYDAVESLFDEIRRYLERTSIHLRPLKTLGNPPTPALVNILADALIQVFGALTIATKYCNSLKRDTWFKKLVRIFWRRAKDYGRVLFDQTNVREVLDKLKELAVHETQTAVAAIYADVRESKRLLVVNELRSWLRAPNPLPLNYEAKRRDGSCAWFFDDKFEDWKSRKDGMYWVHGRAASGKSVLCSSVIEELKRDSEPHRLAYFYFDVNDPQKKDCSGLVSSLVLQLGTSFDEGILFLDGERRSSNIAEVVDNFPLLSRLLDLSGRTFIIIDALDEFPELERARLLDFLEHLSEVQHRKDVDLRVFVASRQEPDIISRMTGLASHPLDFSNTSEHMNDIREYARVQLNTPGTLSSSEWSDKMRDNVQISLMQKSNGIFLWAKLQLPMLQRCAPSDVERVLDELPSGLNETYERILQNFPKSKTMSGRVRRIFECIAFAVIMFTPAQVAEILSLNCDCPITEPVTLNPAAKVEDVEAFVLQQCPSLIEIVSIGWYRTVQFIHLSVKEYLTSEDLQNTTSESAARHYRFTHQDASITLARVCLSALVDADHAHWECRDYADDHWDAHVSCGIDDAIGDLLYRFLHLGSASFDRWSRLERGGWEFDYGGALHCAARFGLCHHTKRILECSVSACDTPASIIARERNNEGDTALHIAAAWGKDNVVRLLLDHGAPIDDTNGEGEIPLHLAAADGRLGIVRLLLSHPAIDGSSTAAVQCSARIRNGQTALHSAVAGMAWFDTECTDICRLLIEHGCLVDDPDNNGNTPLHLASASAESERVRLLLDHPAADGSSAAATRCRVRNHLGQTPLHFAASSNTEISSRTDAARILLECGALLDDADNNGDTPLHGAVACGRSDIVRLLLEHPAADGSDVAAIRCRARNQRGRTALHNAADRGWVDVCRVLFEHGASVGDMDNDGNTALSLAQGDKEGYPQYNPMLTTANWEEVIQLLRQASEEQWTKDASA